MSDVSKRTIKLRIIAVLATIVLFMAADRIAATVLQSLVLKSSFRYSRLYRGDMNVEILALGNSRSINSFYVPAVEKVTSRDCGSLAYNGTGSSEMLTLFDDLLKTGNQKPDLVLLEATCIKPRPSVANLRPFWSCSGQLASVASEHHNRIYRATRFSNLFRFNTEMTYRILYYLIRDDRLTINRYSIQESLLEKIRNDETPIELEMPTRENMASVVELIRLARENGITVHVYLAPYLPIHRNRISNLDEWCTEYRRMIGDTPFWDLSNALNKPEYFADRIHTNFKAADRLAEIMNERGMFKTNPEPASK